jgi:hypothetical protein
MAIGKNQVSTPKAQSFSKSTARRADRQKIDVQPMECPEPCCGGDPAGVDCAEHPDLQCEQPDDVCPGGRAYGCAGGGFFVAATSSCEAADAGADVGSNADGDVLVAPNTVVDAQTE